MIRWDVFRLERQIFMDTEENSMIVFLKKGYKKWGQIGDSKNTRSIYNNIERYRCRTEKDI